MDLNAFKVIVAFYYFFAFVSSEATLSNTTTSTVSMSTATTSTATTSTATTSTATTSTATTSTALTSTVSMSNATTSTVSMSNATTQAYNSPTGSSFHVASFLGGMMLAFLITMAVVMGYKLSCPGGRVRYSTLVDEHDAII
ncbi:hypothetical protein UPYG_G00193140 [Umbra pygmaea]|uniref:Uncharacterized protein n=1 Tax=Umbra pygmaea TaxID=75934 RepID=A0ABD0X732_UMBPY